MPHSKLDFSRRSPATELMDEDTDYPVFRDCLRDLSKVNRVTLAYGPTLNWLQRAVGKTPLAGTSALSIVDVGSGYGDMLRAVDRWAAERQLPVRLAGVDLNPHSARAASEATASERGIDWVTEDAMTYSPAGGVDIVLSSLFTHHLSDQQIVTFIRWMEATARRGWFISDLHRHALPYYVFGLWARLARWHPFVRHDGPISIARAFVPADWRRLCAEAGLQPGTFRIRWHVPFRLTVERIRDAAAATG